MENDDGDVGRVLTRRDAIRLLGAAGIGLLTGCRASNERAASSTTTPGTPIARRPGVMGCVVRPEQTEGPYFVDEKLQRSDIRSDPSTGKASQGVPLDLEFAIARILGDGCEPIEGAVVDLWHCDALGVYSDVRDFQFDTTGQKFLRGYQVTDARGIARFKTIYPGWYRGRTVHVHFKVRNPPRETPGYDFTSQLYFDDAVTDRVHAAAPYAGKGRRDLRNDRDGIFRDGGSKLLLDLAPQGAGFASAFNVALQIA